MTNLRRPTHALIALLAAVAFTILNTTSASAQTRPGPETRVRALDTLTANAVRHESTKTPASIGALRPEQSAIVVGACVATEAGGASSRRSIGDKIAGQMGPRGWSKSLMQVTIDNPATTHTVWDFTSGTREAATAYARADGGYVVANDATRAVAQVSDINKVGWKPVWDDPRFQR